MGWLQQLDSTLFRFINQTLSNSVFDTVMPFLSGNISFIPLVVLFGVWLIWKYRKRGALCVLMLLLIVGPGDACIANKIKHAVGRPRPFLAMPETRLPAGRNGKVGMPSSHAANWGAATIILFMYFRRSLWITLPLTLAVSFSRVYNGVHYPGDVLVGAILGGTYACILVFALDAGWRWVGRTFSPNWLERTPSLIISKPTARNASREAH